jgi:hypothetical protein
MPLSQQELSQLTELMKTWQRDPVPFIERWVRSQRNGK